MTAPILRSMRGLLAALGVTLLSLPSAAQARWHVDDDAPLGGDGLSWQTAFNSLDKAFTVALVDDRIWVAEGTYRPMILTEPGDPRSATILVPQGVRLLGGFRGDETSLSERAGLFRQTILDGDIGVPGDASDNAYHVVSIVNPSGPPPGATRVDGFTITGGNAVGGGGGQGGGVLSWNSATRLKNCIIAKNRAVHGAAVHGQPGSMKMSWCTVQDNEATDKGGAIWGHVLFLRVFHCTFQRNRAAGKGGAVYLHSMAGAHQARFDDCLFTGNAADVGGAVFLGGGQWSSGAGTFSGCTFAHNRAASSGGGLRAVTGTQIPADGRLYNCVVWGNAAPLGAQLHGRHTVNHCDVQGGAAGNGNLNADPLFADPAHGDYRLLPGSPCADAGSNDAVPPDELDVDGNGDTTEPVPLDLAGQPRRVDDPGAPDTGSGSPPLVDLGAYER